MILDGKDRDGLVLVRRSNATNIADNIKLELQPQFLINRAILGETNSYKNSKDKNINPVSYTHLTLPTNREV